MPRLYEYPPSGNCYKIRLLLQQLEIPLERVTVDILNKESRTPEFLALNPNGSVPLLQLDSGELLAESNAILFYFAAQTSFLPTTTFEQAKVLEWMFFEQYSHEPNIATSRFIIGYLKQPEKFKDLLAKKQREGYAALDVMEKQLTKHDFLAADQYTIADIALFAYTHVAEEGNFSLENYPAIRQWLARVQAQPNHIPITA